MPQRVPDGGLIIMTWVVDDPSCVLQLPKVRERRHGTRSVVEERGTCRGRGKAERAHAQLIADAEQIVPLAERPGPSALCPCPVLLPVVEQDLPPSVRRGVGEHGRELVALLRILRLNGLFVVARVEPEGGGIRPPFRGVDEADRAVRRTTDGPECADDAARTEVACVEEDGGSVQPRHQRNEREGRGRAAS